MAGGRHAARRQLFIRRALGATVIGEISNVAVGNALLGSGRLGAQVQDLPFPGPGRIVAGFLITVALAVAAAYLLRRFWPNALKRRTTGTHIRLVDRTAVSTTLTLSIVEIDGSRFLVAEGRGALGVTALPGEGAQVQTGRGT